jgi:integrase
LLCLLTLNGLRVSEACNAQVTDLSTERGHRVLTVTRKGGRRAQVALAPRNAAALETHLDGRTSGPLLLANDGGNLDRYDATRIVRRLARAAGISKHIPLGLSPEQREAGRKVAARHLRSLPSVVARP